MLNMLVSVIESDDSETAPTASVWSSDEPWCAEVQRTVKQACNCGRVHRAHIVSIFDVIVTEVLDGLQFFLKVEP